MKTLLQAVILTSLFSACMVCAPLPAQPAGNTNAAATFEWKHADWKDPDQTIAELTYDNLPLAEVVHLLKSRFTNYFDVVMPESFSTTPSALAPDGRTIPAEATEVSSISVKLQLKNVTASEIFNALNLKFDLDKLPLRWELLVNGRRPTAVLRVLEVPRTESVTKPSETRSRAVFYVGDAVDSRMPIDKVLGTIAEIADRSKHADFQISIHKDAELIVVSGTREDVDLIRETLAALKQKAEHHRAMVEYTKRVNQ